MSSGKTSDRNQKILLEIAARPGNDVCADCKARIPRWASHNLGIFICVNCASIHRKIGTHITKVKSLTLDSWTKEQVERMKEMGNVNSNAIYNPNELRHPPPPMLTEDERDSELEKYIRAKYEYKKFFDRHALVASKLGPSRSASTIPPRSLPNETSISASPTPPISARPSTAAPPSLSSISSPMIQSRSFSQPIPSALPSAPSQPAFQQQQQQQTLPPSFPASASANSGVWNDLVSLQAPSANSSLPLQYQAPSSAGLGSTNPFNTMNGMNSAGAGYSAGLSTVSFNNSAPNMGMGTGPNGLTINAPFFPGAPPGSNPFQQNPFAQQPMSAGYPSSATHFSAVPTGLSSPYMAQQSPLYQQSQASPMISQMQMQSPQPMFSPAPQTLMQQNQFGGMQHGGHSPQPQLSSTPLPMSATPQFQGQFMSPSPQLQQYPGMNGQSMQQQTQMYPAGGAWGQQQQQQPSMYAAAGQGQQWGGM